jgi:hypothetical protein
MSSFGQSGLVDSIWDVRFTPKSGHWQTTKAEVATVLVHGGRLR